MTDLNNLSLEAFRNILLTSGWTEESAALVTSITPLGHTRYRVVVRIRHTHAWNTIYLRVIEEDVRGKTLILAI